MSDVITQPPLPQSTQCTGNGYASLDELTRVDFQHAGLSDSGNTDIGFCLDEMRLT